jgi:signal transduction histidine kinase
MSAGTRLSPAPPHNVSQTEKRARQRSTLARLLHALNQPLTGLQCSMELALALPRRPEQYVRTLREGIELTNRMRMLADAMRELIEMQESGIPSNQALRLQEVLVEVIDELRPVAETRRVRIGMDCDSAIAVAAERRFFVGLIFRLIDSLLSLAAPGSEIGITGRKVEEEIQLRFEWGEPESEQTVEFCPAELGLVLAATGCERIGGRWERSSGDRNTCTMWLPRFSGESPRHVPEDAR